MYNFPKRFFSLSLLMVFMCAFLNGCSAEPPNVEAVEDHFQNNRETIQIVVDFLLNIDCPSVYINTTDGTMLADLDRIEIKDNKANNAIKRLLGSSLFAKKQYRFIIRERNTIIFAQWSNSQQVGCGIAYSINKEVSPSIQYCTKLVPLSENGWYYYVDDYNTWRVENS